MKYYLIPNDYYETELRFECTPEELEYCFTRDSDKAADWKYRATPYLEGVLVATAFYDIRKGFILQYRSDKLSKKIDMMLSE